MVDTYTEKATSALHMLSGTRERERGRKRNERKLGETTRAPA